MPRACPNCSEKSLEAVGSETTWPVSTVFLLGGYLFSLSYAFSRKLRYQCGSCRESVAGRSVGRWLIWSVYFVQLLFFCLLGLALMIGFTLIMISFFMVPG